MTDSDDILDGAVIALWTLWCAVWAACLLAIALWSSMAAGLTLAAHVGVQRPVLTQVGDALLATWIHDGRLWWAVVADDGVRVQPHAIGTVETPPGLQQVYYVGVLENRVAIDIGGCGKVTRTIFDHEGTIVEPQALLPAAAYRYMDRPGVWDPLGEQTAARFTSQLLGVPGCGWATALETLCAGFHCCTGLKCAGLGASMNWSRGLSGQGHHFLATRLTPGPPGRFGLVGLWHRTTQSVRWTEVSNRGAMAAWSAVRGTGRESVPAIGWHPVTGQYAVAYRAEVPGRDGRDLRLHMPALKHDAIISTHAGGWDQTQVIPTPDGWLVSSGRDYVPAVELTPVNHDGTLGTPTYRLPPLWIAPDRHLTPWVLYADATGVHVDKLGAGDDSGIRTTGVETAGVTLPLPVLRLQPSSGALDVTAMPPDVKLTPTSKGRRILVTGRYRANAPAGKPYLNTGAGPFLHWRTRVWDSTGALVLERDHAAPPPTRAGVARLYWPNNRLLPIDTAPGPLAVEVCVNTNTCAWLEANRSDNCARSEV